MARFKQTSAKPTDYFFLKYNCCSCTENDRDSSSEGKPYNKIAFRVKPVQKETLATSLAFVEKIKTATTEPQKNETAAGANKTTLSRRLSSDSQSPLISVDSTSDSQHSKHSEGNKQKEEKLILNENDVKELSSSKENRNHVLQEEDAGTTYVKVYVNQETTRNQNMVQDDATDLNSVLFDTDIRLGDIGLLDSAKETVL